MLVGKVVDEFEVEGKQATVRYERMTDAEDFMKLRNSLVEEKALIGSQEKIDEDKAVEMFSDSLEEIERGEGIYLVLEVEGQVVGTGSVSKSGSGAKEHTASCGVCIRKEWRNKGLGTRLMENLLSEAEQRLDVEVIELSMNEANEVARNLYEELGFEKAGEIEKGIKHDDKYVNKVIMQKVLI